MVFRNPNSLVHFFLTSGSIIYSLEMCEKEENQTEGLDTATGRILKVSETNDLTSLFHKIQI